MARPPRLEYEGATYHVIARGNERRLIFRDDEDRTEYLRLLAAASGETGLKVLAYCLLSNHLHLAVQAAGAPLSEVIGPLHSKYARTFNRRHGRTGHLFESRYRAILLDRDAYLLSVVRYIHLNPVKARLVSSPERYGWSSHRAYLGTSPAWLSTAEVLGFFRPRSNARGLFQEFVSGGSTLDVPAYSPDDATFGDLAGGEAFRRQALRAAKHDDLFLRTLTVERLVSLVAENEGVSVAQLRGPSRVRTLSKVRGLCAVVGRDLAQIPIAETARYFRRDQSTLSRDVKYLEENASDETRRRLEALKRSVKRVGGSNT